MAKIKLPLEEAVKRLKDMGIDYHPQTMRRRIKKHQPVWATRMWEGGQWWIDLDLLLQEMDQGVHTDSPADTGEAPEGA